MIPPHKKNLKKSSKELIIGAVTLLMALAWNDAFKNYIEQFTELRMYGMFIYAVFMTITALTISYLVYKI
jgi:hypothetical protein